MCVCVCVCVGVCVCVCVSVCVCCNKRPRHQVCNVRGGCTCVCTYRCSVGCTPSTPVGVCCYVKFSIYRLHLLVYDM